VHQPPSGPGPSKTPACLHGLRKGWRWLELRETFGWVGASPDSEVLSESHGRAPRELRCAWRESGGP
jgi:hypothetical protein